MAPGEHKPVLLSILVCDLVLRDEMTQKLSLIGLFNRISSAEFPCRHPQIHVFLSLTDGHGTCPAELRLVHRRTESVLAALEGEVQFPSPNAVVEMSFDVHGMMFPEPGHYSFDFFCSGELIGSRPFEVTQLPPPSERPPRA